MKKNELDFRTLPVDKSSISFIEESVVVLDDGVEIRVVGQALVAPHPFRDRILINFRASRSHSILYKFSEKKHHWQVI